MKLDRLTRSLLLSGVLSVSFGASSVFLSASEKHAITGSSSERITTADLGGADRYLAHVSTDKPIYRPGEKVYVRSIVLNARDHKPLEQDTWGQVEIIGPKGDTVASGSVSAQKSVAGFAWEIPATQAGGEYNLKVTFTGLGIAPAERKFDIRAFRAPRLKSQIDFLRDGYGPGDEVGATLEVTRAEGGAPEGAKVEVTARVDGAEVFRKNYTVDEEGMVTARFTLPEEIERGEGVVAFAVQDGGVVETATKTLPILLQTVDLSFYPEGGELIARLPNRVYFQALTPAKRPADIAGLVLDSQGTSVGDFRSAHEGRGRFEFLPIEGESYSLMITEPSGIHRTFPLPEVQPQGVVIHADQDVYASDEPVVLHVGAYPFQEELTVTLSKREQELAADEPLFTGQPARALGEVLFTPPRDADGVLIATVWDGDGMPLAERLIYRAPRHKVHFEITSDKEQYTPGGKVRLTVKATNEKGKPVSAMVGLTVTDDSVLEMIEKREQAPRLPVMVLLEDDVQELADAHVYLDEENPDAPLATDLLLGVQGWRRFALVNSADFLANHADDARRVLAMRTVTQVELTAVESTASRGMAFPLGRRQKVEVAEFKAMVAEGMAPPPAPAKGGVEMAEPVAAPVLAEAPAPEMEAQLMDDELVDQPVAGRSARAAGRELRQALEQGQKRADKRLLRRAKMQPQRIAAPNKMIPIRVYAHTVRPNRQAGDRKDFMETLYWTAGVETDSKTGEASVDFDLSDAVTGFRVHAEGFDSKGGLGASNALVESIEPFYVEAKMPLEVTEGDEILLPLSLVNATSDNLGMSSISLEAAGLELPAVEGLRLGSGARARRLATLTMPSGLTDTELAVRASAGAYSDTVRRKLHVVPRGFPLELDRGGLLGPDSGLSYELEIPKSYIKGSVRSQIVVYPTPLANLTTALERLIREPYGCFEQTSSTTYPLVMAQQYFTGHQGVDPKLISRSSDLLEKGYNRLLGFETKEKGYEWFGQAPGHETLSAYGLMEFTDMATVRNVDQAMLKRTRSWILKASDGEGGFKRERRALHTWIEDRDSSNGYITWSLLATGQSASTLKEEVETVLDAASRSDNRYVTALGANVALLADRKKAAKTLLEKLARSQSKEGYVDGATTSIVGSGGISLQIETTGLATLAWLRDPAYAANVEKAMKWLAENTQAGRFGSTQATVLALKAIVAYDEARARPKANGKLLVLVDGKTVGKAISFDEKTQGALTLPDIAKRLSPGKHRIEVRMEGGSEMPMSLNVRYHADQPASSSKTKVALEVALNNRKVVEGRVTEARVNFRNLTNEAIPTPVAIIGIPGGLEVRHDQLKGLVKRGKIAAYEVIGREVVLYWRSLAANQEVDLSLSLIAAIPGSYTGPASRGYLYYTDEFKQWVPPMEVRVEAKKG